MTSHLLVYVPFFVQENLSMTHLSTDLLIVLSKTFLSSKKQHKSLSTLELKDLLPQSTIPIHLGAQKAFKENNISN